MKLLIFGGSGFVSRHLAENALADGNEVWCVTRGKRDLPAGVRGITADRSDPVLLKKALQAAATHWDACLDCICFNADHARTDLAVLPGLADRVIVISTDSVYRPDSKAVPQTEEADAYMEDGGYGALKRQMELVFISDGGKTLPYTLFRPGHIFGPGSLLGCYPLHSRQAELPELIRNGRELTLVGGDTYLIHPVYVKDLCRAMLDCLTRENTLNRVFCIGGPDIVTNAEYFRILGELMGHPVRIRDLPAEGFAEAHPEYSGHLCNRAYDLTALKNAGVPLPKTTLREGLAEQIRWLEKSARPLRVVIAMDSFKGSLTSLEAGNAVKQGILAVHPDACVLVRPAADGGEGTVEALTGGHSVDIHHITVTGPLGDPTECMYRVIPESGTAILEMSAAAGLTLVPPDRRNPLYTTTYGVGEMIRDAIGKGCRKFIVGIGGSATNDGGIGMLQALGFDLLDQSGARVQCGAVGLRDLVRVETSHVIPALKDCTFHIACDVTNPLCGPQGCSAVFGPQKGATPGMIREMDQWLRQYAARIRVLFPDADPCLPGTGAAGGIGFAFLACMNAELKRGIDLVLEETGLEQDIRASDLVITGEGRLDGQSVMGKTPAGVAALAKKHQKPVIAFCGSAEEDAEKCHACGIDAYFPVLQRICTLEEAMEYENAVKNISSAVTQVFRLLRIRRNT